MTLEQYQKVMLDARTNAFKQMVADGVITQAQADWMLSRMGGQAGQNGGFGGQGGCPGMGGGYNGGNGSRWNTPPSQTAPTTSSSNGAF